MLRHKWPIHNFFPGSKKFFFQLKSQRKQKKRKSKTGKTIFKKKQKDALNFEPCFNYQRHGFLASTLKLNQILKKSTSHDLLCTP